MGGIFDELQDMLDNPPVTDPLKDPDYLEWLESRRTQQTSQQTSQQTAQRSGQRTDQQAGQQSGQQTGQQTAKQNGQEEQELRPYPVDEMDIFAPRKRPSPMDPLFNEKGQFNQAKYLDAIDQFDSTARTLAEIKDALSKPVEIGGETVLPVTSREDVIAANSLIKRITEGGISPKQLATLLAADRAVRAARLAKKPIQQSPRRVDDGQRDTREYNDTRDTRDTRDNNRINDVTNLQDYLSGRDLFSGLGRSRER